MNTRVVTVVALLLTALLLVEAWYLYGQSDPVASAERPVVSGAIAQASAVGSAASSTSVTPYRALVTVVRSDSGWLVSDIETP